MGHTCRELKRLVFLSLVGVTFGCGTDGEDDSPRAMPARVVFSVQDLDLLGTVEVHALGESWLFEAGQAGGEDESAEDCDVNAIELDAEALSIQATSELGFEWDFEHPLRRGECNVVPISLDNPTSGVFAVMALNDEATPLKVYVDDTLVGTAVEPISEADFIRLNELFMQVDFGELRRRFVQLRSLEQVALFIAPPGTYRLDVEAGGVREPDSIDLFPGYAGFSVHQVFNP